MGAVSSVIDDRDTTLSYSGWWEQRPGRSREFRQTTTRPLATGSKLTFSFRGTFAEVHATLGVGDATSMSFWIDGNKLGSYSNPQSLSQSAVQMDQTIFTVNTLADAHHTFMIQVDASTTNGNIYIDYILTTARSIYGDEHGYLLVDDGPISLWKGATDTSPPDGFDSSDFFFGTVHEMNTGASVTLAGPGIGARVFGPVPQGSPNVNIATFTVDNGQTQTVSYPSAASGGSLDNYKVLDTGVLPYSNSHNYNIQSLTDHLFYFDYAIIVLTEPSFLPNGITGSAPPGVTSGPVAGPSSGGLTQGSASLSTPSFSATLNNTSRSATATSLETKLAYSTVNGSLVPYTTNFAVPVASNANANAGQPDSLASSSPPNIGAVVGGVLGGLAVLISLFILFVIMRRQRHSKYSKPNSDTGEMGTSSTMLPLGSIPTNSQAHLIQPFSPSGSSTSIWGPEELPPLKAGQQSTQALTQRSDRHASLHDAPPGYYN